MGCYAVGSECCNNCIHWDCHSERKFRGNPPKEVYTDSNCDKCSLTGRNTLSKDTCGMFKHIGGITRTFAAEQKHAAGDYVGNMLDSLDEGSRGFLQATVDFMRENASVRNAKRVSRAQVVDDDDFDGEAEREFARTMAEQGKANDRTKELLEEGMDSKHLFQSEAVEFMHLLDKAKSGSGKSQFALAHAFWEGTHGAKKEDKDSGYGKGWHWFDKAVENDYCWAVLLKGISCRNEAVKTNSKEDHEAAVEWLEKAMQHSEVVEKDRNNDAAFSQALNSSRISLGVKYLNAQDVDPDYEKALAYFEKVASSGDSRGTEYKKKAEELYEKLNTHIQVFKEAAEGGNGDALNIMGMIFAGYSKYKQWGLVIKRDDGVAVDYFQKAAAAHNPDAMDNLGNCYKNGNGVDKDVEKAVEWYRKSAECGWLSGVYHYATCLRKGEGVEKDEKEALRWYMKAGASGHGRSLNMLGSCAEKGHGMNEDPELAFEWYRLAAESGDAESMNDLGRCYLNGYGCEENESLGNEWQAKAEENGYSW